MKEISSFSIFFPVYQKSNIHSDGGYAIDFDHVAFSISKKIHFLAISSAICIFSKETGYLKRSDPDVPVAIGFVTFSDKYLSSCLPKYHNGADPIKKIVKKKGSVPLFQ